MGFETMGGMKVLALKGIEKQGHLWAVRYTRHHGRNVQDAIFSATPLMQPRQSIANYSTFC
jgi:hypothetical protein